MAEAKAILRYVRVSPQKARIVVDMVRGKDVPYAFTALKYTHRAAAKILEKLLKSAVANAEQQELGDQEDLLISKAYVDGGPVLKRFQARAQGRAGAIHKRTSHITLVVSPKTKVAS
jgi:large subunit ribosomal protein L22